MPSWVTPACFFVTSRPGNLDTKNTEMVLDLLDALVARGITVLVITHESSVSKRAQRRLRIVDGFVSESSVEASI